MGEFDIDSLSAVTHLCPRFARQLLRDDLFPALSGALRLFFFFFSSFRLRCCYYIALEKQNRSLHSIDQCSMQPEIPKNSFSILRSQIDPHVG